MPLLRRNNGDVPVQLCFVKRPNEFFGRLRDCGLRRHHLIDGSQPFLKNCKLICRNRSWHYGCRVPFLAFRFRGCACFLVARLVATGTLAALGFATCALTFESEALAGSSVVSGC